MLPRVRTDRGAIRFVLSGAHIMCPGLTHENARMQEGLEVGDYVVRCIYTRCHFFFCSLLEVALGRVFLFSFM